MGTLLVAFESKELRMVCENQELADEKFGAIVSGNLQDRLGDLMAATCIHDILLGNPRQTLIGTVMGYKIELSNAYVLSIIPGHLKPPLNEEGKTDWNKVTRVKIISIEQEK